VGFPRRACQAENNAETLKTLLRQILEKEHAFCTPPATTEFAETIWNKRAHEPLNKRNTDPIMPESTPPKPRLLDPDIARLREAHAQNVLDLKRRRTSATILQTILEKRLPAMTDEDVQKLLTAIGPKPVPVPLPPPPKPPVPPAAQGPRPAQPMPGVPARKP
jgi:hypothetical protein